MTGRPSNRDERYEQVMQALIRCVARRGIEGASLAAIAHEAGLSRPAIRHHLGNRDDILRALQIYLIQDFNAQTDHMRAVLPDNAPATALIDLLFSDAGQSDPDFILAFATLTAKSIDDPDLRADCREAIHRFENAIAQAIMREHPRTALAQAEQIARGISALYFNAISLSPLGLSHRWHQDAQANAMTLLKHMENAK